MNKTVFLDFFEIINQDRNIEEKFSRLPEIYKESVLQISEVFEFAGSFAENGFRLSKADRRETNGNNWKFSSSTIQNAENVLYIH